MTRKQAPRKLAELKWADWKQVLMRTAATMLNMDTSLRCAGVAFFGFLSIFPSIAIVVLLVGLLVWPGHPVRCALLLVLALGVRPVAVTWPTVTFLDVGQGDAALVELPDGQRWLVDGGPPGQHLVQYLRRTGVRRRATK